MTDGRFRRYLAVRVDAAKRYIHADRAVRQRRLNDL
jgi:hypothetical protein